MQVIFRRRIFRYSFGYNFDYIRQQNTQVVLMLKSVFIYNIHHPNYVKYLTLVIIYSM